MVLLFTKSKVEKGHSYFYLPFVKGVSAVFIQLSLPLSKAETPQTTK
jgi:hypothetical protein